MHFCKATIALSEDVRNVMMRDEHNPISWPEVEIIRSMHGDAAVTEIIPFVRVNQTSRAERQRLAEIYGDTACADIWGGKAGPSEMEAPDATVRAGVAWMNPITREVEITDDKGGSSGRPVEVDEETEPEPFGESLNEAAAKIAGGRRK